MMKKIKDFSYVGVSLMNFLKRLRKRYGVSLKKISETLGLNRNSVYMLEHRPSRNPTLGTVFRYLTFVGGGEVCIKTEDPNDGVFIIKVRPDGTVEVFDNGLAVDMVKEESEEEEEEEEKEEEEEEEGLTNDREKG